MLSIVVIFHDMRREAERTLHSLSTAYQRNVVCGDYEVIAIDNASRWPLSAESVERLEPAFRYRYFRTQSVSPAAAVNYGASIAEGEHLAVIVDGARLVTPGIVSASLGALKSTPTALVCSLAFHLGPDVQNVSIERGYSRENEDSLLESIDWCSDGYRLFDISTLAQSSAMGFFGGVPPEFSWFAMKRSTFDELGGFDERFQSPGGGLVNHDFRERALNRESIVPVVLVGEGSFHQIHGGVASNVPLSEHPINEFKEEFFAIHGKPYQRRSVGNPIYFGDLSSSTNRFANGRSE